MELELESNIRLSKRGNSAGPPSSFRARWKGPEKSTYNSASGYLESRAYSVIVGWVTYCTHVKEGNTVTAVIIVGLF